MVIFMTTEFETKKRLIFCFDGTWNSLDKGHVTNVGITAQSIAPVGRDGLQQIIYYDEGVGNARHGANWVVEKMEKWGGGLLGNGLLANLAEAYKFLIFNYRPGDEIFIFGFSRGAFSARSFTGLIRSCGILRRSHAEKISQAIENYRNLRLDNPKQAEQLAAFRFEHARDTCVDEEDIQWRCKRYPDDFDPDSAQLLSIKYLGVWDTVGSLGIPNHWGVSKLFNHKYRFHDTRLSTFVEHARHAVAIDERRKSFIATLWDNVPDMNSSRGFEPGNPKAPYQEVWFPGTHGSVGGGGGIRGLSDEALNWVLSGAKLLELTLDTDRDAEAFSIKPDYTAPLVNVDPKKPKKIMSRMMGLLPKTDRKPGPSALHQVSRSAKFRWAAPADQLPEKEAYRPAVLDDVSSQLDDWAAHNDSASDTSATSIEVRIHIVVKGDSLFAIAKEHYGDGQYYKALFKFNSPPLTNEDEIHVGQEIKLPEKSVLDDILASKDASS